MTIVIPYTVSAQSTRNSQVPVMGTDAGFVESVAQLKAGGEYSFHRYELPDDHPSRRDGELNDYLTLGLP
jgi:hypothetical protein